jgi:hypothetical protein
MAKPKPDGFRARFDAMAWREKAVMKTFVDCQPIY